METMSFKYIFISINIKLTPHTHISIASTLGYNGKDITDKVYNDHNYRI